MQIVIDIPEEMYQKIKETSRIISGRRSGRSFDYILFNAINTGTPLPKGHGDLIDRDALECTYVEEVGCEGWMHCVVRSLVVKEAQVIIPAEEVSE